MATWLSTLAMSVATNLLLETRWWNMTVFGARFSQTAHVAVSTWQGVYAT